MGLLPVWRLRRQVWSALTATRFWIWKSWVTHLFNLLWRSYRKSFWRLDWICGLWISTIDFDHFQHGGQIFNDHNITNNNTFENVWAIKFACNANCKQCKCYWFEHYSNCDSMVTSTIFRTCPAGRDARYHHDTKCNPRTRARYCAHVLVKLLQYNHPIPL